MLCGLFGATVKSLHTHAVVLGEVPPWLFEVNLDVLALAGAGVFHPCLCPVKRYCGMFSFC